MIRVADRDWITAVEAATYLGPDVKDNVVRAWAFDGKIQGYRIGREVYYPLDVLTEVEHATRTSTRGNKRVAA